jgi:hypothetical protein
VRRKGVPDFSSQLGWGQLDRAAIGEATGSATTSLSCFRCCGSGIAKPLEVADTRKHYPSCVDGVTAALLAVL